MQQNGRVGAALDDRPVRLVVRDDDLARSRLTVALRLLLAIPHLLWVALWGIAALLAAVGLWLVIVVGGKAPAALHDFVAGFLRYATHVSAYLYLAADAYPGFRGAPGYAIDLEIAPPARQSRWTALGRLVLALPALALATALAGGLSTGPGPAWWATSEGDRSASWLGLTAVGVVGVAAFLAWFAILARGHAPRGLRDVQAYALGYGAQAGGYLLLLTDRYPTSSPELAEAFADLPEHPVRIEVTNDLERSRLTVLFRPLLAIPHVVWLALWTIAVLVAVLAAWITALVTARVPGSLQRFLAAWVRYDLHVNAFLFLVGRRFPGFSGRDSSYAIDVRIEPAHRLDRGKVLFRAVLVVPALLLTSALAAVLLVIAVLAWPYGLVTGRMPEGLRDLGATCLRYAAQTWAYLLLLTDRYPYAAPVLAPRGGGDVR